MSRCVPGRPLPRVLWLAMGVLPALFWGARCGSAAETATAPAAPAAKPAATTGGPVDLLQELRQIEAAAHALDPAAPDATARLCELVTRLAAVSAGLAGE